MPTTRAMSRNTSVPIQSVGGISVNRDAVDVHVEDLFRLSALAMSGSPIFNTDDLRIQKEATHSDPIVCRLLNFVSKAGYSSGRTVGPVVVLHSFEGCRQQPVHTDYDPTTVKRAKSKPLGVLLALQDDTKLEVEGGMEGSMRTLLLDAGDVAVFDGDFKHAGSSYETKNTRVHVYLDVPGVHRETNKTYLVDDEPVTKARARSQATCCSEDLTLEEATTPLDCDQKKNATPCEPVEGD